MANVEFKFNVAGLNEIMKSAEMEDLLTDAAGRIASAAGEGYAVEVAHPISFISIASVFAETFEAKLDNSKNNTLLKSIDSGRF